MRRFSFLMTMLLAGFLPALAVSDSAPEDLDHNRRLLERYHSDPEHYARLLRDLRAFEALPAARQEKMRQFDRALHEEDSETQNRLSEVLERYVAWVDRLPEADRARIDDAAQRTEKLTVVRELRQQEWIEHLPKAEREDLQSMTETMRVKRVAVLREEERKDRQEWVDWANAAKLRTDPASRSKKPTRMAEFPESVQKFVKNLLEPMLNEEERDHLTKAEGQWPRLAKTILELSEKHPVLPPLPVGPIVTFNQLPKEAKEFLANKRFQEELRKTEGKWPQFALTATEAMKPQKRLPSLGASRPAEFDASIQTFLKEKLEPALPANEKTKLHDAEGRWPDYPLGLLALAHKYKLVAPGMSLPGPPELWNSARLPAVKRITLKDFAKTELTAEERGKLPRAGDDQEAYWEALKRIYFNRYPEELKRLQRADLRGPNVGKP